MTEDKMTERRFDAGKLGKAQRTPQGGFRVPASLTRTGVLIYRNADGSIRRELREPSEVFAPESLETLKSAPVTAGQHVWVDPSNWRELARGHVAEGSARQDGNLLAADLVIQDADTLRRIDAGELVEISAGYQVDYVPGPGVTPEGERYDGRQTNIRFNHVLLLGAGQGRAGREAALRLDSACCAICEEGNTPTMTFIDLDAAISRPAPAAPARLDSSHDDFDRRVQAEADRIMAERQARGAVPGATGATGPVVRSDEIPNADRAYARMVEANRTAWQTPAPEASAPGTRADAAPSPVRQYINGMYMGTPNADQARADAGETLRNAWRNPPEADPAPQRTRADVDAVPVPNAEEARQRMIAANRGAAER